MKRNRRPFLSLNATDMSLGASFQFTQEHFLVRKMVMIIVNAAFQKDRGWDRSRQPPNIAQVTLALGSVPMNRYSFETLELLKENVKQWETEWNEGNHAAVGRQSAPPRVQFYVIEISFDNLPDDAEKAYFEQLPTSFNLPPGAGARLRAVAGKLLNQSETYRALLRDLASDPQPSEGASR